MVKLALLTLLGLINLAFWMGLALFWPAGTFDYPLAWLYLALFFLVIIIITLYVLFYDRPLLQSRLRVGLIAEKRPAQKIIQGIASLGFFGTFVLAGLDRRMGWSSIPLGWSMAADIAVFISLWMMFRTYRENSFLSATVEVQERQQVVATGPYRRVRHPLYGAALLLFLASPFALGSYWALTMFPVLTLVLYLRSVDEENLLRAQLKGYTDYCQMVRYRMIPGIW